MNVGHGFWRASSSRSSLNRARADQRLARRVASQLSALTSLRDVIWTAARRDTEHRNVGWHAARQVQVQQRLAVAIVDEEEVARTPLPELDEHARTLPPLRFDVTRERAHRRRLHDGTERKFHAEAPRDF